MVSALGLDARSLTLLFIAAFLAILFLQSGLDKVLDYAGNLSWLKEHFAKSPLRGTVPVLLPLLTLFETAAGLFSAFGLVQVLLGAGYAWLWWGFMVAAASLVMLFFGQRIAKDYAGAATLVPYFLLVVFGLFLLG
ncbi:MAG: DoxX family protein [Bacteroidetes bacterium]|nr:DoxX family protein [Bacteroidota bacterium]